MFARGLGRSRPETGNLKLVIRLATSADVPAIMALEKHAVTACHWSLEQYEQILTGHQNEAGAPAQQPAGRSFGLRLALVLEEGALVQGFLIARDLGTEWEIENIAVAGPARKRGLGTRLLGEFLDQARRSGPTAVFLEVRQSNGAAQALYEKWAFEPSGRRQGYYKNPEEDAIIYRLCLP